MAVRAFLLIQSNVGTSESLVRATRNIPGVLDSTEVVGPYDVIVHCMAEDIGEFRQSISDVVQKLPEIRRILTCVVN
jgi:DNA-binding Lrp family transcriptional regulator